MKKIGLPGLLVLIRHAESERNKAKGGALHYASEEARAGIAGTSDWATPLSDLGRAQAAALGPALKYRYGVADEIIHSGFTRAEETANGILSAYDEEDRKRVSFHRDHRVRERNPGYAIDMTETEVGTHFPWLKDYWKSAGAFTARPPGGESLGDVVTRLEPLLSELYLGASGRKTFIVTHGNTIRCLRFLIEKRSYGDLDTMRWPPNCGIVTYSFDLNGKAYLTAENAIAFKLP